MPKTETRNPTALYCDDPSLAVQAFKDECDINKIIARAQAGQDINTAETRVAKYGDFSNIPSYDEALNLIQRAEGFFMELSPEVRERFQNNPGKMIEFINDSKNRAEAEKLGLVVAKKEPPAPPVGSGEPKSEPNPLVAPSGANGK